MNVNKHRKLEKSNAEPIKIQVWGETQVFQKGKQFLLHMLHPMCFSG